MDNEKKEQEHEKIVVVSGNGKDLDISKVYDHLNVEKPTSEAPDEDKIIIPPDKKQK